MSPVNNETIPNLAKTSEIPTHLSYCQFLHASNVLWREIPPPSCKYPLHACICLWSVQSVLSDTGNTEIYLHWTTVPFDEDLVIKEWILNKWNSQWTMNVMSSNLEEKEINTQRANKWDLTEQVQYKRYWSINGYRADRVRQGRENNVEWLQGAVTKAQEVWIGRGGKLRTMDKIRLITKNLKCLILFFLSKCLSSAFCVIAVN